MSDPGSEQWRRERFGEWPAYAGVDPELEGQLVVSAQEYDRKLHTDPMVHRFHVALTNLARSGKIHLSPEQIEVIGRIADELLVEPYRQQTRRPTVYEKLSPMRGLP